MDQQQQQQLQQISLRWNNHQKTLLSMFDGLLESGSLSDCALAAEGRCLNAHKIVLTACSPYFATLFANQHYDKYPVLILNDVTYQELQTLMDYMYRGQVTITQEQLGSFLKAAESLKIKGLTQNTGQSAQNVGPRKEEKEVSDISPDSAKNSVNDCALVPSMTVKRPPPPSLPTVVSTVPIAKRRKSLRPVKNFSSHVALPVHMSHAYTNTLDVHNTPNPTAHSLADEGKENKPSTSIIPKPVGENTIDKLVDEKSLKRYDTTNGLEIEDKGDKDWSSSCSISDIELGKTDTYEENRTSNLNVQNKICTTNSIVVSSILSSQISMNNIRAQEGMEFTENQDMNKSPNMQDQGLKKYERLAGKNLYSCQNCGKSYSWKSTLKRHETYECGGKEPTYGCPHCEYRSKQSGNLRVHIRKYHTAFQ